MCDELPDVTKQEIINLFNELDDEGKTNIYIAALEEIEALVEAYNNAIKIYPN